MPWIIAWLRRETPSVGEELRPPYEAAGRSDREASWDELLTCIDDILVRRQHDHLDAVREAGFSGKDVPPAPEP